MEKPLGIVSNIPKRKKRKAVREAVGGTRFFVTNRHNGKRYPAAGQFWPENGWSIQIFDFQPGAWGRSTTGVGTGPVIDQGWTKELTARGWDIPELAQPENVKGKEMARLAQSLGGKPTHESRARNLLEMALELGDTPDAIHPQHKRALSTGDHPLGQVPPFNPHNVRPSNAAERHASASYKAAIQNLRRYGGVVPQGQQGAMAAMQDMFATLRSLMQREHAHKEQLEQLAIETVMRLPEFKTLRKAVEAGDLKIEPHLDQPELEDTETSAEAEEPQDEPEEIRAEYDEMVAKRKLINTMIQGAAVANNYASSYYAGDELGQLDARLERDYGKLMAYSEISQFVMPKEVAQAASKAHGSEAQGGGVRLRREADGSVTVVAHGLVFPILVHEIVKGCMEYLSLNDEEDPETAKAVSNRSDFIDDEMYQQQIGPNLWREFIASIGHDAAEVMPYVYDELNRMPIRDYNAKMKGLIDGTPEGKRWFRELAQQIKSEIEGQTESEGQELAKRLIG